MTTIMLLESLWRDDATRKTTVTLLLGGFAVLVYFFTKKKKDSQSSNHASDRKKKTTESRLLQGQFGSIIPDDLVLQEEDSTEEDKATMTVAKNKKTIDPPPAVKESFESPKKKDGTIALEKVTKAIHSKPRTDGPKKEEEEEERQTTAPARQALVENVVRQQQTTTEERRPPFLHTNDNDDISLDAFWYWCDVEASLFRIYTVCRAVDESNGGETTISSSNNILEVEAPPYNPSSRRGNVPVALEVTNRTSCKISVFWINYKGAEVWKGTIEPGATWLQTTWIDHPWVFKNDDTVLLHYIPYRVIPTCDYAKTVKDDDNNTGLHRFAIEGKPQLWGEGKPPSCGVKDPIFPYPARDTLKTVNAAVEFALLHCLRMNYGGWSVLKKYLTAILHHPENERYRQIRISNRTFYDSVWNTPARGVLLAIGFSENFGYAELGSAQPFTSRLKELSNVMLLIEQWEQLVEGNSKSNDSDQPLGADGYGRAGFGR